MTGEDQLNSDRGATRQTFSPRSTPPDGSTAVVRRALQRGVAGSLVLLLADLAALRAVTDGLGWLSGSGARGDLGAAVVRLFPASHLDGWQLPTAILLGLVVTGTYGRGDRRRDPVRLVLAAGIGASLVLWSSLWSTGIFALFSAGAMTAVAGGALVVVRAVADSIRPTFLSLASLKERAVFVGDPTHPSAAYVVSRLVQRGGMELVSWVWNGATRPPQDRVISPDRFGDLLPAEGIDTVVLCGPLSDERFDGVLEAAAVHGCRVLAVSRYDAASQVKPRVVWEAGVPFFELAVPALRAQQFVVKRVLDVLLASAGLVLTAPLFAVIAVAIKLDSPGPVFFRQERVGLRGRRFRVVKFRTMFDGVPDDVHREHVRRQIVDEAAASVDAGHGEPVYKLVEDGRVTRVGRILRRTSLDELPQLVNVLRGEMSLVGPRPPLPYELEAYEPWQFERLRVTPGITGLWQVSGRSRLSYRRMCELDLEYVRRWSLGLDLKILARTIPVVLFNQGKAA